MKLVFKVISITETAERHQAKLQLVPTLDSVCGQGTLILEASKGTEDTALAKLVPGKNYCFVELIEDKESDT